MARKRETTNAGETLDQRVTQYIDRVLSGKIVVGRLVRLAVERHVRDLKEGPKRGLYFDVKDANFTIGFCECFKFFKGEKAGQYIRLEPWQCFFFALLFGWKRKDGYRRFRQFLLSVARKNGKSIMAALVILRLFLADREAGAEIYTFATKEEQAKIVYRMVQVMLRRSSLRKSVTMLKGNMSIDATESKCEPLGFTPETEDGLDVSGAIGDEIHAHPDREMWDVIDTATGARRQPLIGGVTTIGTGDDPEDLYHELANDGRRILEGTDEDDSYFPLIYQLDEPTYDAEGNQVIPADAWDDESVWLKANPNLNVSVYLDDLQRKARKAKRTPNALNRFKQKHLQIETVKHSAWLPAGLWASADPPEGEPWYGPMGLLPETIERYRGRPCFGGGDLASVSDLTGLVLAWPMPEGFIDVLAWCWCPRDNAIGRARDRRVPYLQWAETGLMELTEENSVDDDAIRATIRGLRDELGFAIQQIAFDPANARSLLTELTADGFRVFEHSQRPMYMNSPIKETEKRLLNGKLRHGGNRPLAWCAGNVVTRIDSNGNIAFDKKVSREKIDLAVALVMAVGLAVTQPIVESVYKKRGVIAF